MPINILGESRYPEGYRRGPGFDSSGRPGPTLQRIADEYKTRKNNAGLLEAVFENLAPLGMYSGNAEAIHLPSKTMTNARTLASLFQDWFKGGTPTINVPFDKWTDIIKSGKFKNQMELAGKEYPEAWKERIKVEKRLGGFPYPQDVKIQKGLSYKESYELARVQQAIKHLKENSYYDPKFRLRDLNESLKRERELLNNSTKQRVIPEYSESLAKKNPVYGHIYNKKYNDPWDATGFGDTHAEMTDLIKDRSKYVLGDSFHPYVKTAFSSDDMLGNTSRLERALFDKVKGKNEIDIEHNSKNLAPFSYMEMWVPNHLARLNNVKNVYVPGKALGDEFSRSVPVKKVPELNSIKEQYFKDFEDSIPDHLKAAIDPEDFLDDFPF